jgi:hypothetical protein
MPIREFFHLIHIVDNEDEVDAWYREVFSPRTFMQNNWLDAEKRWASLSMVGDLMIEVIEPSGEPGDQGMALSKFRNRFGQHYHSLAWYVDADDIKPLFDRLRARGVRVAKPGGGMFPDGDIDPGNTIFTHPKDTFGQLEFEGLADHWRRSDPRFSEGWSTAYWRDEHPLGIVRASHLTTLVNDLDRARDLYEGSLDATVFHTESTPEGESLFLTVGADCVVELLRPRSADSLAGRDLASNGELPHACTFAVRDLDAAERHVDKLGIGVVDRTPDAFTLNPADAFGAVYSFTERAVPGDPRTR